MIRPSRKDGIDILTMKKRVGTMKTAIKDMLEGSYAPWQGGGKRSQPLMLFG